ncbi:hypothetical protein [Bradyrhizobium sp. CER78]|uniref:hypothetical protein n=1 Tax=Bradyrhizobium sp. CER78 TaxID=3039162 RepID=UPI00244B093C|nr:hypothetical protein [Bradyrhizobium sp. CER78]MDH2381189.1 hypothetical protein [Bradyrhizobium sp. CER78]
MIDPVTAGAGAAASLLALDPVKRLLGPTADFLGAELAAYTKRRWSHAEKVIELAAEHVPEPDGKSVPPRVLLAALDEGSKIESEIGHRYFAGVLASSRSESGEDDSGVVFTSMLSTMSSEQMKLHCALYTALHMQWAGSERNLGDGDGRGRTKTAIKIDVFLRMFGGGTRFAAQIETGMFSLYQNGLIDNFRYFETGAVSGQVFHYLSFTPTVLGCQLFLAAIGQNRPKASDIISGQITFKPMVDLSRNEVFDASAIQEFDPSQHQAPLGPIPPN